MIFNRADAYLFIGTAIILFSLGFSWINVLQGFGVIIGISVIGQAFIVWKKKKEGINGK